jgi:hypothetical protein
VQIPGARNVTSPIARTLPRPVTGDAGSTHTMPSESMHNVPRPPQGGMTSRPSVDNMGGRPQMGNESQAHGTFSPAPVQRSVPRPPANFGSRASQPMAQRSDMGSIVQPSRNRPDAYASRASAACERLRPDEQQLGGGSGRPKYSASNASLARPPSSSYSTPDVADTAARPDTARPLGAPRSAGHSTVHHGTSPQYNAPRYGGRRLTVLRLPIVTPARRIPRRPIVEVAAWAAAHRRIAVHLQWRR